MALKALKKTKHHAESVGRYDWKYLVAWAVGKEHTELYFAKCTLCKQGNTNSIMMHHQLPVMRAGVCVKRRNGEQKLVKVPKSGLKPWEGMEAW
jgi:hypothetical protein